jgi:hypothetical protein
VQLDKNRSVADAVMVFGAYLLLVSGDTIAEPFPPRFGNRGEFGHFLSPERAKSISVVQSTTSDKQVRIKSPERAK